MSWQLLDTDDIDSWLDVRLPFPESSDGNLRHGSNRPLALHRVNPSPVLLTAGGTLNSSPLLLESRVIDELQTVDVDWLRQVPPLSSVLTSCLC